MKNSLSLAVFIITFIAMYFVLSAFGSVFTNLDYTVCIANPHWFVMYSLFIGWWIALIPAIEYYELLEKSERA